MKKFYSVPLARGLVWLTIGLAAGIAFVAGIRLALGLPAASNYLFTEHAWVFGGVVGTLAFLASHGVMSDWFKWWRGQETSDHHDDPAGWLKYLGPSLDHKVIGIQYTVAALILLVTGGTFALIFRTELSFEGQQFLQPGQYNTLMSLHGMIMIVSILLGIAGMMNYLVPLLIGAPDMAFPRLNAFSFWLVVPASVWLLLSMPLGGVEAGWTGYPPLSANPSIVGPQMFFLGVFVAGWSSILGALNLIATVVRMRSKGMTTFRVPIFVWAAIATSLISLTATQLIGLSFQMVMFQRLFGMGFFDPAKGGNPILFQHLFWFYSHPAVYIMILPSMAVISELIAAFSRKRIFGYHFVAFSSIAIAVLGFLVWGHHLFVSSQSVYAGTVFSLLTMLVAIPSAVKVFNWSFTLYQGAVSLHTPMLYALGFIGLFMIGGLTGVFLGTLGFDVHVHDTYFVVAHFHYVMVGGTIMGYLGGLHFWWPKITGRMYSEFWSRMSALLVFVGFNLTFFPQFLLGYMGMPRRYHAYPEEWQVLNVLSTAGASVLALGFLLPVAYFFWSLKFGAVAGRNPWGARGLEWETDSPPPTLNFDQAPVVDHEAYNYADDAATPGMKPLSAH